MARSSPRTWVYNELVTASIMNTHIRDQQDAYWPYTTAGDLAYASAADTITRLAASNGGVLLSGAAAPSWLAIGAGGGVLTENGTAPSWLAKGTAGESLMMNAAATAPEWSSPMLDWEELTVADWTSGAAAAYQTVPNSTITLVLPAPGVVFSIVTCNLDANGAGDFAALRTRVDATGGDVVQTKSQTEYYEVATVTAMKACAAGNIDCDIQIYGEGAVTTATIINAQITAWAIAGA